MIRCKNCGAENDASRYICEVCGSPLYDEEELAQIEQNERTRTFRPVNTPSDKGTNRPQPSGNKEPQDTSEAEKKSIIVISLLVVILIAIIVSVVAIAHNNRNDGKTTEKELTRASSTSSDYTDPTEDTTEEKTEKTTKEKTTEKTTKAKTWKINTASSGGGETEGDGKYNDGDKVTLIARADDGYTFDGWYSDGELVSSKTKYTFRVHSNASFSAVFSEIPVTEDEMPENDTTEAQDTTRKKKKDKTTNPDTTADITEDSTAEVNDEDYNF